MKQRDGEVGGHRFCGCQKDGVEMPSVRREKTSIDDSSKHAFKSLSSKSVNQWQLVSERAQTDNRLCSN